MSLGRRESIRGGLAQPEDDPFHRALRIHLEGATGAGGADDASIKADHLAYAASLQMLLALVSDTSDNYSERALGVEYLEDAVSLLATPSEARDRTALVTTTYQLAQARRLSRTYEKALEACDQPDEFFYGSGAEPYRGVYCFELAAALAEAGNGQQIRSAVTEYQKFWASDYAVDWPSRNRFEFAIALSAITAQDWTKASEKLLVAANILDAESARDSSSGDWVERAAAPLHLAQAVSVWATSADVYTTFCMLGHDDNEPASEALRRVLELLGALGSRWGAVIRSSDPLARVLRILYGDLAAMCARLKGPEAGKVGLGISLATKATGLARMIRSQTEQAPAKVRELIGQINDVEVDAASGALDQAQRMDRLADLRSELRSAVTPMFAQMVLPMSDVNLDIVESLGGRGAIDFIKLPGFDNDEHWYRAFVLPHGEAVFERFELARWHRAFVGNDPKILGLRRNFESETIAHQRLWSGLGEELLPRLLLDAIADPTATAESHNDAATLVICPHGEELADIPWAALITDSTGTRLLQQALPTVTPSLSCLSERQTTSLSGEALVRLVSPDEQGVPIGEEAAAWGLDPLALIGTVMRCAIRSGSGPTEAGSTLADCLIQNKDGLDFVHIAGHGSGYGLNQGIRLGHEKLTAASALGVRWPESVFLSSCHIGHVENTPDDEPYGLVLALLSSGARTVVAGIDYIWGETTAKIAAQTVRNIRAGQPLQQALRHAQLEYCERPVHEWALLTTYTA